MRRYRNVPPLQLLQGFEAAARLGSFSKAASELGLSQSAVSHEIRLLEQRLGQPLFLRVGRKVQLTDAGQAYQRSVRQALDDLDNAQQRLAPFRRQSSVIIYAPRDFGRRWLLPRLENMLAACPDCQPWIDTSGTPIDFAAMEISIAVIHAEQAPAGMQAIDLARDIRFPYASPKRHAGPFTEKSRFLAQPLLADESLPGWDLWFEDTPGYTQLAICDFSDADAALVAAEAGLGIALASEALVRQSLADARLQRMSDESLDTGRSWFAITNEKELQNKFTGRIWQWFAGNGVAVAAHQ